MLEKIPIIITDSYMQYDANILQIAYWQHNST